VFWKRSLSSRGLGGIAATKQHVIVSDRELNDSVDVFRCFDAETGRDVWAVRYVAPGKLDYGNAPRATPLVLGRHVYLLGAMGHMSCVELVSGRVVWRINVRDDFDVTERLPWGFCGSPLIVDGGLILNPGGEDGSIAALDPENGKVLWSTPGNTAAYGSFIAMEIGKTRQIVGHDAVSLGGWDAKSGKRLWTIVPSFPGDFNVPTPVLYKNQLLVSTENNGTRMFAFRPDGQIEKEPIASFSELAPDTHTPIVVGSRLFGVSGELYCLDLENQLQLVWKGKDRAFQSHVSLLASNDRLLASTETGELLLIDATANEFKLLDRQAPLTGESGLMSHPAVVGRTIYLRGTREILALSLEP
jgi:outer membrane protein assembly factor BamB